MPTLSFAALCAALTAALVQPAAAQPAPGAPPPGAAVAQPPAPEAPPADAPAPAAPATAAPPPATAVAALDRATAAYQYGDMDQVVIATRPIADGALSATEAERAQALRLLGIGLHLTGRANGAEEAFVQLLRLRPKARLDPATTRPEVVAFFEAIRRRHAAEIEEAARSRTRQSLAWAFLPPLGQFKNGDTARGILVLGLEVVSLAGAITTSAVLASWRAEGNTYPGHTSDARTLKTLNHVSVGLLAATYAAGVIDALLRSNRDPEERPVTFVIHPAGLGLRATF